MTYVYIYNSDGTSIVNEKKTKYTQRNMPFDGSQTPVT